MPIVPIILINSTDGIGTGWATKIPNYDPRQVVANLQRLLRGKEPHVMLPWFKNFRSTIALLRHQKIASLSANKLEITELPERTWTINYKEDMEKLVGQQASNVNLIVVQILFVLTICFPGCHPVLCVPAHYCAFVPSLINHKLEPWHKD